MLPMNLHVRQLPKLLAECRSSAIFGVAVIAMIWVGVIVKYSEDVRGDQREAERANYNFAMVFEENVLRSIGEIDKALLYLRRSIETRKDTADFNTIVGTTDVLSEIIVQVAIIDANGIMRASNIGPQPAPATDLSDREHFKAHLNGAADVLFMSKPVVGRISGRWSVQFSRRFSNADGTFAGVVVASLNPEHLTKFYDKIDFGSSASISLIGLDGVVRSSGGSASGFALGQSLRRTKMFARMQAGINSTFEDVDPSNGEVHLVTIRKVRDHPLWVSISTNENDIRRSSWATLQINIVAGVVLTLILLAAMERLLRTEAGAKQKAEQLQRTLENMSQGIMLVTKDLQIPIINGRCGELLDLPAEFIKQPPSYDRLVEYQTQNGNMGNAAPSNGRQLLVHPAVPAAAGQLTVSECAMRNGTVLEVRSGHLSDGGFVQTFTDITKRWEAEAHAARLASEDPLTGLPNRRVFRSALDRRNQERDLRRGDDQGNMQFAVLFLDIDRFKVVNDTLGHRVGDLLLRDVAKRLRASLRPADELARLGGDEFAIMTPSVESRAELELLASRLVEAVVQPYEIDGYQIRTSISIGIAIGPDDGQTADDLLIAADLALYAVKAGGRGTHKFYHGSMSKEFNDRRQTEMDLREAIERNELELHYQPIVDLRREVITGFEALARWRHPVNGMVPPATFIPVAEDSGLILPLGEWVLAEACRRAAQWPNDLKIAVNLSPVQFSDPNLLRTIERILAETGLAPNRLELEITERIFMDSGEITLTTLRRLKELGIRISMDDFGTGYSSLSYLRSFPFDKIKVDRMFVSDLGEGSEHMVIVQAVLSIASALGMTATAEGVETDEQRLILAGLGCDEAQGYFFSRPVPIEEVSGILDKWTALKTLAA
jgi:diguanylate cyclase (GGDEF)-like protein